MYPICRWARNSRCRAYGAIADRRAHPGTDVGPWRDASAGGAGYYSPITSRCAPAHAAQVTLRPLSPLCLSILLALASREGAAQARSRPIGVVKLGESTASVEATNVGYALITVSDGDQEQSVVVRADALAAWVDSARAIIALVPAVQPKGQVIFASPQLVSDRGGGALQLWSTVGGHNPGLAINVVTPGATDLVVPLSAGSFGELAQVLDLAVSTTRQLSPRTFARAAPPAAPRRARRALAPGGRDSASARREGGDQHRRITAATPPRDDTVAHDPLRLGTPAGESVSHVDRGALATGDANASSRGRCSHRAP